MHHISETIADDDPAVAPIGVGLIGFGMSGAVFHAPLLASLPMYELRTIAFRHDGATRQPLPSVRLTSDVRDVLSDPAVELVIVATPNASHARVADAALRAGRHVVIEKPLTPAVATATRLIRLARDEGRILTVFHSRRWDDDFLTAAAVVTGGRLGRVHRYVARFEFFARAMPPADWRRANGPGSGLLFDVGSHSIDQAIQLFGRPANVTAHLQAARGRPDHGFMLRLQAKDVEVILLGSERVAAPGPSFEVHGDAGSLVIDGPRDGQEARLAAGSPPGPVVDPPAARLVGVDGSVTFIPRVSGDYRDFYRRLARAIRIDGPPPVSPESARDVVQVIAAARASARTGRTVSVRALGH